MNNSNGELSDEEDFFSFNINGSFENFSVEVNETQTETENFPEQTSEMKEMDLDSDIEIDLSANEIKF